MPEHEWPGQARAAEAPPAVVLNHHVEGERPILIYRVDRLGDAVRELSARGWTPERGGELPIGTARTFKSADGQRVAIYEATRPEVVASFAGRRDFARRHSASGGSQRG